MAVEEGRAGHERAGALHPGAWLAWLVAATAAVFLTSNPLYLSLGFLAAGLVYLVLPRKDGASGGALGVLVHLGLALAVLSVPFNVLTGSSGPTELARLPELRFPASFGGVTLGGAVTAEALVSAGARATTIATLVLVAASFSSAVDHVRLLRLAPPALAQLALTLSIAVLIMPEAVGQARAVQEAQRLRGRRARGLGSLPGLLLPTLQGALERSVQRAESLDARGFGGGGAPGGPATLAGVVGLGVCAWGGFAHFYYGAGPAAALAMAAGAVLVAASVLRAGRRRSRLRAECWTLREALVAVTALVAVLLLLGLRATGAGDADYLPYPEVAAPAFHPAGAAALLLLAAPALASQASEPLLERAR